jgi:hypothetical protein
MAEVEIHEPKAEGLAPPADITQFDALYDALSQKFPGLTGDPGGAAVFQFAASPIEAGWTIGVDVDAYDIANAVPLNLGGFYEQGDPLDTAYQDLILSVKPANYSDNPAYTAAETALGGMIASRAQTSLEANSAYQTWAAQNLTKDGTPAESQTAWLLDPMGGAAWQDKLDAIRLQIAGQNAKIAAIVASMDGALARAQKAAQTDTMPISRAGGPAIQVPSVSIDGDLGGDVARWAQYPDGQYDFQVVLDGNYVVKTPWKTLYTTTTSQHCWQTSVDVNVDTSRIIEDVSYRIEFNAVGVASYPIKRGRWYDADYVSPKVQITPGATVTSDTFFGLSGTLHLIPETLFVMFRPTFKLTVSTQCYKQQFQANASADIDWIDLFSFRFRFDGLASLQPVDNGDGTTTMTFASPANAVPQIIGVTSKAEWNGSKSASSGARELAQSRAAVEAPVADTDLVTAGIRPQNNGNFDAFDQPTVIRVARVEPLGAAPFVVYDSNTRATLGAGSCPALSAHPPYVSVYVPPNIDFTVQNLSPNVSITVSY